MNEVIGFPSVDVPPRSKMRTEKVKGMAAPVVYPPEDGTAESAFTLPKAGKLIAINVPVVEGVQVSLVSNGRVLIPLTPTERLSDMTIPDVRVDGDLAFRFVNASRHVIRLRPSIRLSDA